MIVLLALAAAFVVNDGYAPSGGIAWLCPQPETAAEIGLKVEAGAPPLTAGAFAQAHSCLSWEDGALNVRDAKHVGSQEIGLIRLVFPGKPEISYWVARNSVRWTHSGKRVGD